MSDEELLEMYEREWKSLMDKVNEVEQNIVQTKSRIASNAAQQPLAPDVCHVCKGEGVVNKNGRLQTCTWC